MGSNDIAEVFYNGQWGPICGHWFWENDIGASLFCQELGFPSGKITKTLTLPSDGLRVGMCQEGDNWLQCSQNDCNQLEFGGFCNNGGNCQKGQNAAVAIECSNQGIYNVLYKIRVLVVISPWWFHIQPLQKRYTCLQHKPYVNEVILTEHNLY